MTTDRLCPLCHSPVEAIYSRGRHVEWDGSRLYECRECEHAYPLRELASAPERPYNERGERDEGEL